MASEPYKLKCLKTWQAEGVLPLQTHFPTPLGLFRVSDFVQWLLVDSGLSTTDRLAQGASNKAITGNDSC